MGLPSRMSIFVGNVPLYSSSICCRSVIFAGHKKSYFLKNKVIQSIFSGHKNGPSNYIISIKLDLAY